jgi:hypothetical protein
VIRHETDPHLVNRIANSDAVRPFLREDGGSVDLTRACQDRFSVTGVVVLSNGEDAVALFDATAIAPPFQAFQTHILFGATCRGRRAIDTFREMLAWVFARGATLVWGSILRTNRRARWFVRQVGFKATGGDRRHEYFELRTA